MMHEVGVKEFYRYTDFMLFFPIQIKRVSESGLEITWNDESTTFLSSRVLRESCPSAVSRVLRGEDSHSEPLTQKPKAFKVIKATSDEQLALKEVWPVGNYAIGIRWGDGHASGIYPYNLLRDLVKSEKKE
jgi:DUF971 family protein